MTLRERLFLIAQKILVEEQEAEDAVPEVLLKLCRFRDSESSRKPLNAHSLGRNQQAKFIYKYEN